MTESTGRDDPSRIISDPNTGEVLSILQSAEECGGEHVILGLGLSPGAVVPPHAHPTEEVFECVDGEVQIELNGRSVRLQAGGSVTAPRGHVHSLRNTSQAPASLRIVASPGAEAEYGLRLKFLLSRDGYLPTPGAAGPPKHLLLGAVVLHRGGLYFPPLPRWLFRSMMAILAALGRWRGREQFLLSHYPEYTRYREALAATHRASGVT